MTEQRRLFRPHKMTIPHGASVFAAVTLLAGSLFSASPAFAQSGPITVDLSVIQDGGRSGMSSTSQMGLMIPPQSNPVSELHVAPQNTVKLTSPMGKAKVTPAAPKEDLGAVVKAPKPETEAKASAKDPSAPKPMPLEKVAKAEPVTAPAPTPVPKEPSAPKPMPMEKAVKAESAPPPPPKVTPAPEPTEPTEQAKTASKAIEIALGQVMRIEFDETATKLPDSFKDSLRKIADGLHDKKDLRLQLMAYAGAESLSSSKARRLSLSRALSVRSFLIESGVRSTRIDVRALGNKTSEKPANRVDVNIAKR